MTLVRNEANKIAQNRKSEYVIIDGSPGIGCPVIASLTGADLALIVTEATVSGTHDLKRIAALTKQLRVPAMVCVNKWDINAAATESIRRFAGSSGMAFAGTLRYDKAATEAQRAGRAVAEFGESALAREIRALWTEVELFASKKDRRNF